MSVESWKALVQKQLKIEEDVMQYLQKGSPGAFALNPVYASSPVGEVLPRKEESPLLVSSNPDDETAYAFLLDSPIPTEKDKTYFFVGCDIDQDSPGTCYSLDDTLKSGRRVDTNYCVDLTLLQNAGASAGSQLAVFLAKTKELIELYGIEVLQNLVVRVAVGYRYFEEIAKIRAIKILCQTLAAEYSTEAVPYLFAETSLRNKSVADPENNLVRSTVELAAAMVGGADAVYANTFKPVLPEKDALTEEISYKQLIILAYESILNVFQDAGAGSGLVEDLTERMCEAAWMKFCDIEASGGYRVYEESGSLAAQVYEEATAEHQQVLDGTIKLVGINLYPQLLQTKSVSELYDRSALKPVRWSEAYE